jgi:hypothetical protein
MKHNLNEEVFRIKGMMGKIMNEQFEDNNEEDMDVPSSDEDMSGGESNLVVSDNIFIPIRTFYVDVSFDGRPDPVTVTVTRGSKNEAYFEIAGETVPEGQFAGDFINAVREKFGEDVFNKLPYDGTVLNIKTGEAEGY